MALTMHDIRGIYAALPTPTDAAGGVATEVLRDLCRHVLVEGVAGLVPVGGTGEYTSLTPTERLAVVESTIESAGGRTQIIPGVVATGYGEAVETARLFADAGADAIMLVTPFYSRPTQAGIIDYFRRVRDAVDLPIILYDVPDRTGVVISPQSVATLARDRTVIGMKASGHDVVAFSQIVALARDDLAILSGTDRLMPVHCAMGARGAVMSMGSLCPAYWREVLELTEAGRVDEALERQRRLFALYDALGTDPFPTMLRVALGVAGFDMGPIRPPLLQPLPANVERVRTEMAKLFADGLLRPAPVR